MYKIHDLKPNEGSNRDRKRVGRGIGGKGGKTAGRGTKGQKARSKVPVRFEGGQMPLYMRVPKRRGFNNPFRVEYQPINLDVLSTFLEANPAVTEISPEVLFEHGLVSKNALVKILGRGELSSSLTVKAHGFSASATEAITSAGGTVEVLPKPWGEGRPPVKGNQFANR